MLIFLRSLQPVWFSTSGLNLHKEKQMLLWRLDALRITSRRRYESKLCGSAAYEKLTSS
jgi:hypothetical protein